MTVFSRMFRLPWARWGMLLLVATGLGWGLSPTPVRAAARQARPLPGVTMQACGAMTVGADGARLVRPGEILEPGDRGFGCLFTAKDVPKDGAVPVEVRLLRPTVAGGQAWDRWFVALRPGRTSQAVYLSETPLTTASGPWTLELYRDGRPAARRQFVMAGGPGPSGDQDGAAQPSVETPPALAATPPAGDAGEKEAASPPTPVPPAPAASASSDQAVPATPVPTPPASAHSDAAIPAPVPVPPVTPIAPEKPVPSPASPASPAPGVAAPKSAPVASPAVKPAAPAPAKRDIPVKKSETARPAPAAPERKEGKGAAEKPQGAGYYALQLGVFAQSDNAEALAVKVRGRGVPVCVAEERTAKGRRYRVMAGRYGDRRVALDRRREIRTASGVDAVLYHVEPAAIDRLRCH